MLYRILKLNFLNEIGENMGKKDVNKEISGESLLEIIAKLEDAIDFTRSMIEEKPSGESEKSKESKIAVGSEVEWEDKDGDDQEGEVIKIKERTCCRG